MHTSATISYDESLWPLLVVKFVGTPTTPQLIAHLGELTRYLERGERYALVLDTSGMKETGPSEQRMLQVEWLKKHEAHLRERQLGVAFVITSPLVRLGVSIVFFLKPAPTPYFITINFPDAVAWAARQLEEKGLRAEAARIRAFFKLPPASPPSGSTPGPS